MSWDDKSALFPQKITKNLEVSTNDLTLLLTLDQPQPTQISRHIHHSARRDAYSLIGFD